MAQLQQQGIGQTLSQIGVGVAGGNDEQAGQHDQRGGAHRHGILAIADQAHRDGQHEHQERREQVRDAGVGIAEQAQQDDGQRLASGQLQTGNGEQDRREEHHEADDQQQQLVLTKLVTGFFLVKFKDAK